MAHGLGLGVGGSEELCVLRDEHVALLVAHNSFIDTVILLKTLGVFLLNFVVCVHSPDLFHSEVHESETRRHGRES